MQPYSQPVASSDAWEDAYILPPPAILSDEYDKYEVLKRRSQSFLRFERVFLTAIPVLFFTAVLLNFTFYIQRATDDLTFVFAALFRAGLLLGFLSSLGVLWTYRRSLPSSVSTRSPLLAVALMLIPVYNLYRYYVEFALNLADGSRALEELEGNRLSLRAETLYGHLSLWSFVGASVIFTFCFSSDPDASFSAFGEFLIGERNFFGTDLLRAFAWVVGLTLLLASCGLHLAASRSMSDLTVRILEVRQTVEPFASEAERAATRAQLTTTLNAPPSR